MADVTAANSTYTKVRDTVYDSKLIQGLEDAGVIPSGFRLIKAHFDVTESYTNDQGTTSFATEGKTHPFLDDYGQPVLLAEGDLIIKAGATISTAFSAAQSALEIGISDLNILDYDGTQNATFQYILNSVDTDTDVVEQPGVLDLDPAGPSVSVKEPFWSGLVQVAVNTPPNDFATLSCEYNVAAVAGRIELVMLVVSKSS